MILLHDFPSECLLVNEEVKVVTWVYIPPPRGVVAWEVVREGWEVFRRSCHPPRFCQRSVENEVARWQFPWGVPLFPQIFEPMAKNAFLFWRYDCFNSLKSQTAWTTGCFIFFKQLCCPARAQAQHICLDPKYFFILKTKPKNCFFLDFFPLKRWCWKWTVAW